MSGETQVDGICRWLRGVWERLIREPAYLFDEDSYQHVFGSDSNECIRSFDCNAGDHSDACPFGK